MSDGMFYANVLVQERGEEDRSKRIGPYHANNEDELRDVLEERGEIVEWIEPA